MGSSVSGHLDARDIIVICLLGIVPLVCLVVWLIRSFCHKCRLVVRKGRIVPEESRTLIQPVQETNPVLSPVIVNVNSATAPSMPRPRELGTHGSDNAPVYGEPPPPYNEARYNTLVPEYLYSSPQYGPPPPKYEF